MLLQRATVCALALTTALLFCPAADAGSFYSQRTQSRSKSVSFGHHHGGGTYSAPVYGAPAYGVYSTPTYYSTPVVSAAPVSFSPVVSAAPVTVSAAPVSFSPFVSASPVFASPQSSIFGGGTLLELLLGGGLKIDLGGDRKIEVGGGSDTSGLSSKLDSIDSKMDKLETLVNDRVLKNTNEIKALQERQAEVTLAIEGQITDLTKAVETNSGLILRNAQEVKANLEAINKNVAAIQRLHGHTHDADSGAVNLPSAPAEQDAAETAPQPEDKKPEADVETPSKPQQENPKANVEGKKGGPAL